MLPSKQQNLSLHDYLLDLFIEEWSTKMNYSMYFDVCAPSFCTYTTTAQTHFFYAITLLISLYGGLIIMLRLIAPFLVDALLKFEHRFRNPNIVSGMFSNIMKIVSFCIKLVYIYIYLFMICSIL